MFPAQQSADGAQTRRRGDGVVRKLHLGAGHCQRDHRWVITIACAIIGFKFSLIVGIISAVAYAIPIIGMLIAELIAVPMCAPQGLWMIVWVQVIMFGMARISDNVLVPKIMGQSVGVSPIGAMFAVFAGGELFGIPGLIFGIPAAALIKILWRYFGAPWMSARLDKS